MGPPKAVRTISQAAFDETVKENMEDLGMDPAEALQDAIDTLSLQGVDLSGIYIYIIWRRYCNVLIVKIIPLRCCLWPPSLLSL